MTFDGLWFLGAVCAFFALFFTILAIAAWFTYDRELHAGPDHLRTGIPLLGVEGGEVRPSSPPPSPGPVSAGPASPDVPVSTGRGFYTCTICHKLRVPVPAEGAVCECRSLV